MLRQFFPRRILQWLGPLLTAALAAAVVAALVIVSGVYNLAARTPHPQYLAKILHFTFTRVVQHQSHQTPPADLESPSRYVTAAGHYAQVCANCHGAPGIGQNPMALAMTPRPPYLVAQIKDLNDPEIFWVLKHGVKYSAMPYWPTQVRDDEIWNMVAFLKRLPTMSNAEYRSLAFGDALTTDMPKTTFGQNPPTKIYASFNSAIPQGDVNDYAYPASGPGMVTLLDHPLQNCARCHGANGTGRASGGFPNLTIQTPAYIRNALIAYANGRRPSAVMQTVAAQLSPDQMTGVAQYFGGRGEARSPAALAHAPDARLVAQGALIAARGQPGAAGAQSCNYCHNTRRQGQLVFPQLQGQDEAYLLHQLRLWRDGRRGPVGGFNPMPSVAHNLTDQEMLAVAAYFASQDPNGGHPQGMTSHGYTGVDGTPLASQQPAAPQSGAPTANNSGSARTGR